MKGQIQPDEMIISSSSGELGDEITETVFPFAEIVHPLDAEKFIHIPSTASHAIAKETMDGLSSSLASLGVSVSTGRVVDFRLKDALRKEPELGTVPLLYPCHFNGGTVHWPKLKARKPNAILDNDQPPVARALRFVFAHETLCVEGRTPPPCCLTFRSRRS